MNSQVVNIVLQSEINAPRYCESLEHCIARTPTAQSTELSC